MSKLVRFGVSLEEALLKKFDENIKNNKYTNRSEAIRDLIREDLVKKQWQGNKEVIGVITLVFNHHKRELVNHLMDIQHDFHDNILYSQHLHMDDDNCLEVIAIKGMTTQIKKLYGNLKSCKGVKYTGFSESTTGSELP